MPASYQASAIPFGGQSTSQSRRDRVAFLRSVLTNRRVAVVLTQLSVLLCFAWFIIGSPFGSTGEVEWQSLSPNDLAQASDSSGSGSSYRGTFGPTTCPASGNCPYAPFATPFDRIRNGTAGSNFGMPIEPDRSKYESNGIMFNPAIMRMPPGAMYELAILTRGPSKIEMEPEFIQRRTVIAYFADLEQGVDVVQKTDSWLFDLQTDASPGCEFPWGSTPGPEDPRAVWSPEGVPLMIVGVDTLRPEACRTVAVMDLRTLWPALRNELERISWPSANEARKTADELERGTEIWFDGIHEREKNWAGFFSPFQPASHFGSLPLPAFHYDFAPQSLLLPNTAVKTPPGLNLLPYESFVPSANGGGPSVLRSCMDRIHGTDNFRPVGFKVADHHATPFHPVTLRGRGTGKKRRTPDDTVLVGLAHAKFFDDKKESHFWYDRFVIILNATAPFQPIAVSPYLNISSLSYESFYFTQSITFLPRHSSQPPSTGPSRNPFFPLNLFIPPAPAAPPKAVGPSLSDGYLDDDVLIAMGEADGLMGSVRMRLDHMLSNMIGCGSDPDIFNKLLRSNAVV